MFTVFYLSERLMVGRPKATEKDTKKLALVLNLYWEIVKCHTDPAMTSE